MAGEWWREHGWVFCRPTGTPLDLGNVTRRSYWPLLARTGLRAYASTTFATLRPTHAAATLLLGGRAHPKVASEMLGHATVGITLDTYSHVTETMQRSAVAVIKAVLIVPESR